ncbi:CHAT domain-containing protein [Leptothoe kymatousa]|uniref:CHAT domain-containing protein n=1 Tax=Leptothoe kymatousa TAU-MAC 1615 TaxID=2364775 RepID=A0ABS5Y721_9CYAN|nr:CHAT domain-containing protein [Leptothoe kymatousa]MBT9313669.1 CHAT domain-containing protein [Leptothoe kymatousa TAU-MAC 1615]
MLKSCRPLTVLVCFFLSFTLTISPMVLPLSIAVATDSPLAQTNLEQGNQLYGTGQLDAAIAAWEQVAQNLAAQGDTLNQASALANLALAYQQLNNWEKAQAAITQSIDLLRALESSISTETAQIFGRVWNTQGNLALTRSQLTQALESFEKAEDYYGQAKDNNGTLLSQINQAKTLQSLGFYRRAITLLNKTALSDQPDSLTKATGLKLLGDLQRATGDLEPAQQTLEIALTTAQSVNDVETIADIQLSLGHIAKSQEQFVVALEAYQRAAATAHTAQLRLQAQVSQWSLLMQMGDVAQADRLYQQIRTALASLPVNRTTVNAYLELARQQLDQSINLEQVGQELAIAQQQAIDLNDVRAESYALGYLGELYSQQQQWQKAKKQFSQALALLEQLNAPDLAYQWHWHLGQLQQQTGQIRQASNSYEQAVNNLQDLRSNLIAVAPDLRFNFRKQVEPVYREWVDLLLKAPQSSPSLQQNQLSKARQAIEALQLAELENFFQEPCVPISQNIDQIIDNATSPTAVVYPIILPDRLEVIIKLPQQPLQQYTVPVPEDKLTSLLKDLQRDLLRPFKIKDFKAESAQLYEWLIQPIEATLGTNQIDTLVFVLDGFLRNIPMAALYDGQQYLVEKYSVALAPGLQLVDPQPLQRKDLAVVIAGLSKARDDFSELPSVEKEVEQVKENLPSRVLLNETFTTENLESAINSTPFPLVHLATHGQFSSNPDETFVLAWDQRIAMNALNRLLRQGEQLRQNAIELLILSACQTAAGDERATLGLAGIAVQAGARSTLASLWNLDDESGAVFSDLFYRELKKSNISKAQALRNTQLRLLRDFKYPNPIYAHPQYWAPYVLLGNWL